MPLVQDRNHTLFIDIILVVGVFPLVEFLVHLFHLGIGLFAGIQQVFQKRRNDPSRFLQESKALLLANHVFGFLLFGSWTFAVDVLLPFNHVALVVGDGFIQYQGAVIDIVRNNGTRVQTTEIKRDDHVVQPRHGRKHVRPCESVGFLGAERVLVNDNPVFHTLFVHLRENLDLLALGKQGENRCITRIAHFTETNPHLEFFKQFEHEQTINHAVLGHDRQTVRRKHPVTLENSLHGQGVFGHPEEMIRHGFQFVVFQLVIPLNDRE